MVLRWLIILSDNLEKNSISFSFFLDINILWNEQFLLLHAVYNDETGYKTFGVGNTFKYKYISNISCNSQLITLKCIKRNDNNFSARITFYRPSDICAVLFLNL